MGKKQNLVLRIWICLGLASLILLLIAFYYRYVPLLLSYQIVLVPLIAMVLVMTALNVRAGVLLFIFIFPLVNSLPYFFGIYQNIPHAPTALILFIALLLGWIVRTLFVFPSSEFHGRIVFPMKFMALAVLISGTITFLRYMNFAPFGGHQFYDLLVNVNGVRSGGALMSCVFSMLNYITGFLLFLILVTTVQSREYMRRVLLVISSSVFVALLFALFQKYHSLSLGNTPFFVSLGRLNATFKDPNSFGLVLAAFIPVLLGMCFAYRTSIRYVLFCLLLLSFFVFPMIGSRSGTLGLLAGGSVFALMALSVADKTPRQKRIFAGVVALAVICGAVALIFFSKGSSLYDRIGQDLESLFTYSSLKTFLDEGRVGFWKIALAILSEFPVTGLGIGSFIVELPNFGLFEGYSLQHTDSAENYFLHVGSELGFIGLVFALWLIYEIWRISRNNYRRMVDSDPDKYIFIGLVSGIVAAFANLFFHSYIGAFDAKYFIWLLIGLVASFHIYSKSTVAKTETPRKLFVVLGYSALGVLFVLHLWNSTHTLSIPAVTQRFALEQNFGLYGTEKDEQGFVFNWTSKVAGISVPNLRRDLVLTVRAAHPGIERHPVRLEVIRTDPSFREIEPVTGAILSSTEWTSISVPLDEYSEDRVYLKLVTDRVWQPSRALGVPDTRSLGVALSASWSDPISDLDTWYRTEKTLGMERWQGGSGSELLASGKRTLDFRIERKVAALLLSAMGLKAKDVGPIILVRLDGRLIGRLSLEREDWEPHVFFVGLEPGEHTLEVEFINDYLDVETGQDRNVYLGSIDLLVKKEGSPL